MNELRIICANQGDAWRAANQVAQWPIQEGRRWILSMVPYVQRRKDVQNRYLWGWLYLNIERQLADAGICIEASNGRTYPYTKDILHEIFKEMFLCYAETAVIDPLTGERRVKKLCYSTTELLKHARSEEQEPRCFSKYVLNIQQFAMDYWGIQIPPTYNEELMMIEAEINARRFA